MTSVPSVSRATEVIYPDSDGQPISDNTVQFRWILVLQQNLDWLFAGDPNVFVAGDLLWYPVEGDNRTRIGPDVMVAGRPKGDRGSYQQWKEGDVAPQVIFEIRSPGNTQTEMDKKQVFYNRFGVEEYYLYDPQKNDLSGWLRQGRALEVIEDLANWASPRLKIRFELAEPELKVYRPDGQPFASYGDISRQLQAVAGQLEQERFRAEQECQRAEKLAARLRSLGIDPNNP